MKNSVKYYHYKINPANVYRPEMKMAIRNEDKNMVFKNLSRLASRLQSDAFFRKYGAWIPAALIAIAIFAFSHQPADDSTATSDGFSQILLSLAGKFQMIDIHSINVEEMYQFMATPVRKSAHAIEFASLNVSLLFALYFRGIRGNAWLKTAFLMTVFYACSDEFHQLFIPGRAGLVSDVLVDSIGAMLVTIAVALFTFWGNGARDRIRRLH